MEYFLNTFWPFYWPGPQRTSHDDRHVENRIIIEGFLYKKASNTFKTWQRRWFMIHNNQLMYVKRSKNVPRVVMDDLRLCTVCHFSTSRRRYCFQVVSSTKSYMLQADSEGTRLAWTRAIENIALVSWPRSNDSEIRRYQEVPAVPGAPDLERMRDTYSVHRVEPPCNDDLEKKTTDTSLIRKASDPQKGVLDIKSTDTYVIHSASSPNQGVLDKRTPSTDTNVLHRESSPHKDLESSTTETHMVQKTSSPSNDFFWTKYTIGKGLGRGGYGTVCAGVRNADGRQVAIKFVNKKPTMKYITVPGEAEPRPAEVALTHMASRSPCCDYVIEFLEWFDHPTCYMLVLEMPSPCMDLNKYINKQPLPEEMAQVIMAQVVVAAYHCSNRGVLHRDIKTENILINPDSLTIKLIDFGCGDVLQTTPYREYKGTRKIMPPELLTQKEYHGCPSTVWSLGILQYEIVCGSAPFKNEQQILNRDLKFTSDLSARNSVVRDGSVRISEA